MYLMVGQQQQARQHDAADEDEDKHRVAQQ